MAWTAPRTWVTAETVTAALLNTHLRDNLLETSAATATTAGDLVYADAANSMGTRLAIGAAHGLLVSTGTAPIWRVTDSDTDNGSFSWVSTSYTNLDEAESPMGVAVTVTTGTAALVLFGAHMHNSTAGAVTSLSYSISGASTVAADDARSCSFESNATGDIAQFGHFFLATPITGGSNTFTLEARVTAGTGTISYPRIAVIPL